MLIKYYKKDVIAALESKRASVENIIRRATPEMINPRELTSPQYQLKRIETMLSLLSGTTATVVFLGPEDVKDLDITLLISLTQHPGYLEDFVD